MVEFIINGDFSATVPDGGSGSGLDPASWTVTEAFDNQVQAVNGELRFNRGNTPPGSSIEQSVTNVAIGEPVSFSMTYGEIGGGQNMNVLVEIIDGSGATVFSQTVTNPGTTVSTSFTGTSNDYTIRITDTSIGTINHDLFIDNVSFDGTLICFASGAMIETEYGQKAVETIKVGDLVATRDRGLQPVRWIGSRKIDKASMDSNPKLRPIRITCGALGRGLPINDLLVSRQHRMVVSSKVSARMFASDVLVSAAKLTELPGIYVEKNVEDVTYFHILFDQHEVIYAEGAPTESLFTGPEALKAVPDEARDEILTLFPKLKEMAYILDPALQIPRLSQQKELAQRLAKNGKAPLESYFL